MTDIEAKRFFQCVQPMSGAFNSTGSGAAVPDSDFKVEYTLAPGSDGAIKFRRICTALGREARELIEVV